MSATTEKHETAPDPEEDDLDDLDDALDEFTKPAEPVGKPTTVPADAKADNEATQNEEDFAKTLEAGMKGLIGELDSNPEMQAEFEKMMQELIAAGSAASDKDAAEHIDKAAEAVGAPAPKGEKESFQATIERTMKRMQTSGESASAAATASSNAEEDFLAQMMKELGTSGGLGGEEGFNKMLMSMMSQLTNKEILYEPMKELHDKFPAWIEKNKGTVEISEMERFKKQQELVDQIVGRFEQKGYSDDNEKDREFIVDKMQQMQAQGSPPPDLVGDMSAAQEALGELEGGCPTQ